MSDHSTLCSEQAVAAVWLALTATAAAFALFFGGLHRGIPPTVVSRLALLSPVVATALGWMLASETLRTAQLIGIILVLAAQVVGHPRSVRTPRGSQQDIALEAVGRYLGLVPHQAGEIDPLIRRGTVVPPRSPFRDVRPRLHLPPEENSLDLLERDLGQ
ncbi:MAG: DMT family transporter, partial [Pseudonocardia sp.]|nr:DMT family transporter [Pseudonocardia sp.]